MSTEHTDEFGAHVLASRLSAYWRARGRAVVTRVEKVDPKVILNARHSIFAVRSDIINGMPVRLPPPPKPPSVLDEEDTEATPAMIEAGAVLLTGYDTTHWDESVWASRLYRAMVEAGRREAKAKAKAAEKAATETASAS